ncbi:hypothetical protein [Falsiroseomonas oryzae]|uniref:hypothetical protein n=1 Tax=Falsiroseomonas oryzae TaxID=2766473 RepID=UPI0022EA7B52|nr:hypothetical protein [Roseomonas sp. MO-31]
MVRRRTILLALTALAGCAAPAPTPPAPPPPRRAQPVTLPERVRQEAWLTRFWAELTPAQKRRVLGRLRRGEPPAARSEAEAAPVWDALGLPERNALVFGTGLPRTGG